MQISNPNEAFFIIMKFINCYGLKYYSHSHSRAIVPNNNNNSLLDEIRRIGFNRIIDSNDNFSILKVKISSDHIITITMNPSLQFHFDLFPKILPFNCSFDKSEEGFLLKLLKLAESELNLLLKAQLIFKQIDESFSTLEPERFDQFLFERRIHVAHKTIVLVSYDSVKKVLHLNITESKSESVDHPLIDIQNNNEEEFIIKTISQFLSTCKTQDSNDIKAECGICYSDYLDGKVAEFPCTHCKQIYHENCLKEWFMTNPECRTIFNQICGSCLFCEKVQLIHLSFIISLNTFLYL